MKKENVKFVLESSAGCVVDHTYDSEIENSSNSDEEEDEEEEIESEYHDNIPIIMTTNKRRKDQHCIWKGSVFQGAVETEDTQFLGENFHTDNTDIESPFYYFRRFFDKEMVFSTSDNTNLYSAQCNLDKGNIRTSETEIEQYLGILLRMCIVKIPQCRMYWDITSRYEPAAHVMSRDRFETLKNTCILWIFMQHLVMCKMRAKID